MVLLFRIYTSIYFKIPLVFLMIFAAAAYAVFIQGMVFWRQVAVPIGIVLIFVIIFLYINRQRDWENL